MRLVDADELKTAFPCGESVRTESVRATIDHMATVDAPTVDPVKHGHWIESDVGLMCSECNHYTDTTYYEPFNNEFGRGWALKRPYYCGYCGAKMDEVTNDAK